MNCKFSDAFRSNQWLNMYICYTLQLMCSHRVCLCAVFFFNSIRFIWQLKLLPSIQSSANISLNLNRAWTNEREKERGVRPSEINHGLPKIRWIPNCVRVCAAFAYVRCLGAIILFICTIYCETVSHWQRWDVDTTWQRHFHRCNGKESSLELSFTYCCINIVYTNNAVADSLYLLKVYKNLHASGITRKPFHKIEKTSKGWSTLFRLSNAFFLCIYWFVIQKRWKKFAALLSVTKIRRQPLYHFKSVDMNGFCWKFVQIIVFEYINALKLMHSKN